MKIPAISIKGNGLGAIAAAASLSRFGCTVTLPNLKLGSSSPHLTLNEKTIWMIGNLFGDAPLYEIRQRSVPIKYRKLLWSGDRIEKIPEASLIISPSLLSKILVNMVSLNTSAGELLVNARGRRANQGQAVGNLNAFVWSDLGISSKNKDWCATISLTQGWVMIAPTFEGSFTAQAFLKDKCANRARSLVEEALFHLKLQPTLKLSQPPVLADAAPRLGRTWAKDSVIMGDECLALDPIAGDGLGHTIRMAFWFISLLRLPNLSATKCKELYSGRVTMAFRQHLSHREKYYREANTL